MENGPFEDVFPIEDGDIPASYVSLPEGTIIFFCFFSFVVRVTIIQLKIFSLNFEFWILGSLNATHFGGDQTSR